VNEYFERSEFACKCGCGFDAVDAELLEVLTDVRETFGPVSITSGNRCKKHNKTIGGAEESQHTKGMGADYKTKAAPESVQEYLETKYPDKYGIGRYPNRTHIDVRSTKARWTQYV